jgi:hypothetical protein
MDQPDRPAKGSVRPPTPESFRQIALRLSGTTALLQTTGAVWPSDLVGVEPEQPPRKAMMVRQRRAGCRRLHCRGAAASRREVRSELFVYGLDFKRLRCVLLLV